MTNISKKEGYLIAQLPFSGFYETLWDDYYDSTPHGGEWDYMREQHPGATCEEIEALLAAYEDKIDHQATRIEISKGYVEAFNSEYGTSFEFESLDSPKYYNYSTDRIFVYISIAEAQRLLAECNTEILAKVIAERFTSYDGFTSFYDNSLENWQFEPIIELDHNELGTIIKAWLYSYHFDLESQSNLESELTDALYDYCQPWGYITLKQEV